jgi:hypothetical protein
MTVRSLWEYSNKMCELKHRKSNTTYSYILKIYLGWLEIPRYKTKGQVNIMVVGENRSNIR